MANTTYPQLCRRFLPLLGLGSFVFLSLFVAAAPALAKARKPKPKEQEEEKAADDKKLPTFAEKIKGLSKRSGFLDLYIDEKNAAIWLALEAPAQGDVILELLHQTGLAAGLGSNPVGLDRGLGSDTRLLHLRKVGNKVLFEQQNLAFRADSPNEAERRAVAESFATSVLWAAEIAAEGPDGRMLIDLAPFLLRDMSGVATALAESGQGEFEVDEDRSAVDLDAALVFPDNVELEAVLTFQGEKTGPLLPQVSPDPHSLTLVQHHSLVRLPPPGFETRNADPRMGSITLCFADFAQQLDQPLTRCLANHFRLEKVDPTAERSAVKKPIVFYVDNGAPEPIRSALVEGAGWWAKAFDAAGYIDAFKVEVLPEDKDPLDVRWNVVQWVHRSTRGWSYGGGVVDPRTGEVIKGHVRLGSQRIRQDRLLFEGLLGTEGTGSGGASDPIEVALARIRQLAAHEVGHAIGLAHNFAASTYLDRASVMDYPVPRVLIDSAGKLDLSQAYGVGIGAWDEHAINYLYRQFLPEEDVAQRLQVIVAKGLAGGLLFLSDDDARPAGASDARANLWDNGDDPVAELRHVMKVRAIGLQAFSEKNILPGTPMAQLREVFAPLYLHHRYQLDATVKLLGGLEHNYALRGDGLAATRLVDAARQRRALGALLELLEPVALDIPESALQVLAPHDSLLRPQVEALASNSEPAFDSLGAAATAAGLVVDALLEPSRLERVLESHHRQNDLPGVAEVLTALVERAFSGESVSARRQDLRWVVRRVVALHLIKDLAQGNRTAGVQAEMVAALSKIRTLLLERPEENAQGTFLANEILRFLERPHLPAPLLPPPRPPVDGSPIGNASLAACEQ